MVGRLLAPLLLVARGPDKIRSVVEAALAVWLLL